MLDALCERFGLAERSELYTICGERLPDVERVLGGLHRWIRAHPERIERGL